MCFVTLYETLVESWLPFVKQGWLDHANKGAATDRELLATVASNRSSITADTATITP